MKLINYAITAATIISAIGYAQAADLNHFQHKTLLEPGSFQLKAEAKGRVMIYDQMDNATVELAMSNQFDRIENMMFVRTQYIQEDGSIVEDNDCE